MSIGMMAATSSLHIIIIIIIINAYWLIHHRTIILIYTYIQEHETKCIRECSFNSIYGSSVFFSSFSLLISFYHQHNRCVMHWNDWIMSVNRKIERWKMFMNHLIRRLSVFFLSQIECELESMISKNTIYRKMIWNSIVTLDMSPFF